MVQRINGRLYFCYGGPKKEYNKLIKANFKLSLLGALIGIFLLPHLAYLSTITPEKLIDLTNQERQSAGLNPLTANQLLTRAAIQKGKAILGADTFQHTINGKKFSAWVRDVGYNYSYVGENLAIDFAASEAVVEAWKNSPLHKKNLLSPYYQEIGVAAALGKFQGQETIVVVQMFGAPAAGSVAPWSGNFETEFLNPSLSQGEMNLFNSQLIKSESLLTNAIINQAPLLIGGKKLALPVDNYAAGQSNTFIIQANYQLAVNNWLAIFLFWSAICSLIFLYYYCFFKINRLISI